LRWKNVPRFGVKNSFATQLARSGIQLYPQSSERKSSHYEATGDYHNSRCIYYKEELKPAIYGAW
jgi:hypothetical protein